MFYLALYKDKRKLKHKIISWWLNCKYTHCEIYSDDGYLFGASSDEGVREKYNPINKDKWDLIPLKHLKCNDLLIFYHDTKGSKYDWKAIFLSIIFNHFKQNNKKFTCSEWIANLLDFKFTNKAKLTPDEVKEIVEWLQL